MGTEGGNVSYGPDTEHEISSVRLREVDGGGGIDQSCAAEGGGGPGIKGSLPSGQCSPHAKLMHPQAAMFLHLGSTHFFGSSLPPHTLISKSNYTRHFNALRSLPANPPREAIHDPPSRPYSSIHPSIHPSDSILSSGEP